MTLEEMKQALLKALAWLQAQQSNQTPPVTPQEASNTNLEWNTIPRIKASIRAICIEMGMNVEQTNTMIATIAAESGFKLTAKNQNKRKDGTVASTDHSLIQVNDHYHIGPGMDFPSVEYVYSHPEEQIRWMCKQWKLGRRNWWIAYKSGAYLKYM